MMEVFAVLNEYEMVEIEIIVFEEDLIVTSTTPGPCPPAKGEGADDF